jgi:hypothetical protein
MNYIYNQRNLIENPEKYMYTKFQGIDLFETYFKNRNNILKKCRGTISGPLSSSLVIQRAFIVIKQNLISKSPDALESFYPYIKQEDVKSIHSRINDDLNSVQINKLMNNFSLEQSVETSILFDTLFASILLNVKNINNKIWLDRLVQRFEVTKKLYEEYLSGFRKGRGQNNLIKLYWLFALVLSIYYSETYQIKYLNTLIKVCDLITSLPFKDLTRDIPEFGLDLILSTEIVFVEILLKAKGIEYDHE